MGSSMAGGGPWGPLGYLRGRIGGPFVVPMGEEVGGWGVPWGLLKSLWVGVPLGIPWGPPGWEGWGSIWGPHG